ncbi:MAG: hypothetical protein KAI81_04415 [Candidatus Marinimicrobia bacterium]|nr:hypothetical protein [Candidatus Neomarinimicrobiota bacterium]
MIKKELPLFSILQLWRQSLEQAICIKEFHIEDDGKTFDFDLKEEGEYNCKDCNSEFCFKSLDWMEDCGDGGNKKLNQNNSPEDKELNIETENISIIKKEIEYEKAYT